MEITNETTVHKLDNIIKQKFNAYERNIDHSYTWNKFKIGTNIVLKKNPEYLNGPHNDKKMMEIVDNIWNEGLKLLPEAYQILIKFDIHSYLRMYQDICSIINEISLENLNL
jgi:hypothetical protein